MKYVTKSSRIAERDSVSVVEGENRCGAWAWNRITAVALQSVVGRGREWWSTHSLQEERGFERKDV